MRSNKNNPKIRYSNSTAIASVSTLDALPKLFAIRAVKTSAPILLSTHLKREEKSNSCKKLKSKFIN